MKDKLISITLIGVCVFICISIFTIVNKLFENTHYTKAAEKLNYLIDDVETLQARQQLNQINLNSINVQKLISFCLKYEIVPPIRIHDMSLCRAKALTYYSLPINETELKEKASRPLKDQLYFSKEVKPYLDKIHQE